MNQSTLIFRQSTLEECLALSLQAPTTEQSIQQAKENANRLWLEAARRIVYDLCASRKEFTADTFWDEMGKTMHKTHDGRAFGAVMREAARNGWCQKSGRWTKTKRENCHGSDIPIWESEIFASSFVDKI